MSHRVIVVVVCFFAVVAFAENPRVFITDSKSWEISGSGGGANGAFGSQTHGGARPQTAEIIKTFGERCPAVTINNKQDKAEYVVVLDHEGGKGLIRRDNKVAVFNGDGDSIVSRSTRSLGSSVQDACEAIAKDWALNGGKPKAHGPAIAAPSSSPEMRGKIQISSEPANADIEVDGAFVGNTPSMVQMASGTHSILVKKNGYKEWKRVINVSGGDVNIAADLEKAQ
jgi:PEGA domain